MSDFTFEQEVFSLAKRKATTIYKISQSVRISQIEHLVENELLLFIADVENLRAKCSKPKS